MIDWGKSVIGPCLEAFGEPATFIPAIGASFPVTGVFDDAFRQVGLSEYGTEIVSVYPVFGVNLADFPAPPLQGDQLKIASNAKTYVVREPKPDSHGGAMLILNYVSG